MKFNHFLTGVLCLTFFTACNSSLDSTGELSGDIRLNQIGYYPGAPKKAVIVNSSASKFLILNAADKSEVYSGKLSGSGNWELAGENVRIADFTRFEKMGEYLLYVPGTGYSYAFEIKDKLYEEALKGTVKGLYYQRAGIDIPEQFGGVWKRAAGHPDMQVNFHPSSGRMGTKASPKGWYDAGDYGKYVVNGAFSLGQLLLLADQQRWVLGDNTLNIPESGNGKNDYYDELKYEMDWLLSMQDDDGGMFFKLTTERFEGMIMPNIAIQKRYIIGKSTAATLDFAAVAARAYRTFGVYDQEYAKKCLEAGIKAWDWAIKNPDVAYKNPEGVVTGEYGDEDFSQEFFWAAAELYTITKATKYAPYIADTELSFSFKAGESWNGFQQFLGVFALMDTDTDKHFKTDFKGKIVDSADELVAMVKGNDYFQPINDFHWGSNSDVANAAMVMAQAYRITREQKYLDAVLETVDYIFGKNALGVSFLTGYGDNTPMHIHHRQSAADGIAEPVPGLLSGGPNSRRQDANEEGVNYPENSAPMKSWVDQEPSYASNEICLNWNAPLTYILGFLEQEMVVKRF